MMNSEETPPQLEERLAAIQFERRKARLEDLLAQDIAAETQTLISRGFYESSIRINSLRWMRIRCFAAIATALVEERLEARRNAGATADVSLLNELEQRVLQLHEFWLPELLALTHKDLLHSTLDSVQTRIGYDIANRRDLKSAVGEVMEQIEVKRVQLTLAAAKQTIAPAPASRKQYDVFICHASEDKQSVAAPLYEALTSRGVSVWYDTAMLKIGDSLRAKIDEGLSQSRFAVVILSYAFFAKGWPKSELDGLFSRQQATGEKVLLPICHGISQTELVQFSHLLAGTFYVDSSVGTNALAREVLQVVNLHPPA